MKISLSPEIERLIAERIKSGRYQSADEVVREGLELLCEREMKPQRAEAGGNGNVAATLESIAAEVPAADWDAVPRDLSKNVDHYLYGGRKTS
jgi:antitoxin ParD1/3/4